MSDRRTAERHMNRIVESASNTSSSDDDTVNIIENLRLAARRYKQQHRLQSPFLAPVPEPPRTASNNSSKGVTLYLTPIDGKEEPKVSVPVTKCKRLTKRRITFDMGPLEASSPIKAKEGPKQGKASKPEQPKEERSEGIYPFNVEDIWTEPFRWFELAENLKKKK